MGFTFVLLSILTSILSTSYAQLARQQLAYGSVTIISPNKSATAHVLDIPASDYLTVSIALCGASFQSNSTFLLINDTRQDVQTVLNAGGGDLTSEIPIIAGYGTWRGSAQGGAVLAFRAVNVSMEIGVSDSSGKYHLPSFRGAYCDAGLQMLYTEFWTMFSISEIRHPIRPSCFPPLWPMRLYSRPPILITLSLRPTCS
jgi:hypothetical protein